MANHITKAQYNVLCNTRLFEGIEAYNKLLEEMTGIKARQYTGYSYYDSTGDYVGDSRESDTENLLESAYVEVENDLICNQIDQIPAADVAPVVHGEGLKYYKSGVTVHEEWVPSCCDMWNNRNSNYFPNYGAKMDGGVDDAAD